MEANELHDLIRRALRNSPILEAARQKAEQVKAAYDEVSAGFYDPSLTLAGGRSTWNRGIPGSSATFMLPDNAIAGQGAFDVPLPPGAYFSLGVAERYYTRTGDEHGFDNLYQTLIGAQVRVPLLRDRAFAQWRLDRDRRRYEYEAARSAVFAAAQNLARDVEYGYISAREALAVREVAEEAVIRAKRLTEEARELARLHVVPEYQVEPALMEQELRMEEELQAAQECRNALARLAAEVGEQHVDVSTNAGLLLEMALAVSPPALPPLDAALQRRGDWLALQSEMEAARRASAAARDSLRSDLSLNVGGTWQGESPDSAFGDQTIISKEHMGGELLVVLRRPLGFKAEESRLRAGLARAAELAGRQKDLELRAKTDIQVARERVLTTIAQLEGITRAVTAARRALEAEQERFRLGEGRSRNVLDAQKDLTAAMQRRNRVSAALLRADADLRHACGLALGPDFEHSSLGAR